MKQLPTYVLEREFDAPRELVWQGWTDTALLSRWYGPNVETVVHKLEVRPGGLWLVEMKMGAMSMFQRIEYLEVDQPAKLVMIMSNADAQWNVAPSSMMPDWPRSLHTTVELQPVAGKTRMKLVWVPHEATGAEVACFSAAIGRMGKGWESGMEKLANILAERP